ncbi:MAG: transporter [Rhodobacteraceae bacterium]|nr:MAG: transporter [Paracoccaceae bacterium]
MKKFITVGLGILSLTCAPTYQAHATTLADALILAYQTNPNLKAARSGLRATDEVVRQAKGDLHPTVSGALSSGGVANRNTYVNSPSNTAAVVTNIPIYAGGKKLNTIDKARYNVLTARENLRLSEQDILLQTVTAYMDVRLNSRKVQLSQNSLRVLREEVRAARERFEVGEVTRTDVSQAESRFASAQSNLQIAKAAYSRSQTIYTAIVGSAPKDLRTPPKTPKLPASAAAAESIAVAKHPSIIAAQFVIKAAQKDVEIAKGSKLPTVSAFVQGKFARGDIGDKSAKTLTYGLDVEQIIYAGGKLNSVQRQRLAALDQAKSNLQLAAVNTRQRVNAAFATWHASKSTISARQKQVRAARIAFEGTTEEAKLGARTTLDALNAEQELLSARTDLVTSIRDEYVNAYTVLSAMGLLTVEHLGLGISSYDPDVNYAKVTGRQSIKIKRLNILDKLQKRRGN